MCGWIPWVDPYHGWMNTMDICHLKYHGWMNTMGVCRFSFRSGPELIGFSPSKSEYCYTSHNFLPPAPSKYMSLHLELIWSYFLSRSNNGLWCTLISSSLCSKPLQDSWLGVVTGGGHPKRSLTFFRFFSRVEGMGIYNTCFFVLMVPWNETDPNLGGRPPRSKKNEMDLTRSAKLEC